MPNYKPYFKATAPVIVKRHLKLLAVTKDPLSVRAILKRAPVEVIKAICNAAINALQGDIRLTARQRKVFRQHRRLINKLISPSIPIEIKRKALNQVGGGSFIPILLATVIPAIGSLIFNALKKK